MPSGVPGLVLEGRWQLGTQLGSGAMGSVFRGRDLLLGREVAIKLLATDYLGDEMMLARFRREAMASSRLVHPNIVTTLDFGVAGPNPYIVMELVEGTPLDQVLAHQRRLSMTRAVSLARDVASGLDAAHRRNIVHRDIKPANVMVASSPTGERGRIVDFGIALTLVGDPKLTQAGIAVGTPGYVAPEQLMGSELDGRADLFSLGVTLFQMLTGELPWVEQEPVALLRAILDDRPRALHLLRPDAPNSLAELLVSLLRSRPHERPNTAAEVAIALEAITAELASPVLDSGRLIVRADARPLALAGASMLRDDRRRAEQQLRWFTRCVQDEGGRIAQSIGHEVIAVLPSAEAALRLARTHPSADVPRPSLALHQGPAEVDETGMALGPGVRATLRLARLAGPEEVLLTEELHAALGLGWRGRVELRGRFLLDTQVHCQVYAVQGEGRFDSERAGLEAAAHVLHWRCVCGGHGEVPTTSSTLLRVRCSQCSRLLEVDLSQPTSPHANDGHPLTSIVLTTVRPSDNAAQREDDAVIAALAGFSD